MGWWITWDVAKDVGTKVWENASLTAFAIGTASVTYNTIDYLCRKVSALPKVAYSIVFHQNTKTVASHLVRIGIQDVLPMVTASYTNDFLQRRGQAYLNEQQQDESLLSVDTLIQSSLILLNTACWIYTKRRGMQAVARTVTLIVEASSAWTDKIPKMKICEEEQCSTLSNVQGSFQDLVSYYGVEGLIKLVSYIPIVGEGTASALSIYHNGRYITTLLLPICSRHQELFLKEYPEYALANGLALAGTSALASWMIESSTGAIATKLATLAPAAISSLLVGLSAGIPRGYYETAVHQLLLIAQVGIAAHGKIPKPVKKNSRNIPDPVALYVGAINFSVDWVIEGGKKKLPSLFSKQSGYSVPWEKLPNIARAVWANPVVSKITWVFLPRMLQNSQQFIDDPLISYHWEGLKQKAVDELNNANEASRKYVIRAAVMVPNATTETVWFFAGTPKILTRFVLAILGNQSFQNMLADERRTIEGMHSGLAPSVVVGETEHSLRGQEEERPIKSKISELEEELDQRVKESPEDSSAKPTVTSEEPERGKLLALESKLASKVTLAPSTKLGTQIHKRHKNRFFSERGDNGKKLPSENETASNSANNLKFLARTGETLKRNANDENFVPGQNAFTQ
ncbi:hypothetical protein BN59_00590 [Legionella massiliensis]|uniref:Uncharacterized protein n=1 Tax=Legionella massiliensis TaxID=1034943 RepID=A0A078KXA2_9GAMM|nr:hypothetical protein [Legionella massiliensis]CDZ76323.1 hypothetical protein BN59_00590 [Legionella massiliensis]CEE12061.1 hypothetical protein BN1094_00590 [Legionella massiliensis]